MTILRKSRLVITNITREVAILFVRACQMVPWIILGNMVTRHTENSNLEVKNTVVSGSTSLSGFHNIRNSFIREADVIDRNYYGLMALMITFNLILLQPTIQNVSTTGNISNSEYRELQNSLFEILGFLAALYHLSNTQRFTYGSIYGTAHGYINEATINNLILACGYSIGNTVKHRYH